MTISVGDKIPSVNLFQMAEGGPAAVSSDEILGGGKVVLFAVPGAFTPTCSDSHLPGFVENADAIRAKGVDGIVCLAVNDPFVMGAWGKARDAGGKVRMVSDGNGDFTKAIGMELDLSVVGLGTRSKRYSMIVEDGVVKALNDEGGTDLDVSSAEAILNQL